MKLATYTKQPAERTPYTIDYSDALTIGDSIPANGAVVSVVPTGLVIDQVTAITPRVRFYVAGGTSGTSYKATFTVTTHDGEVFQDEVIFKVKEI